MPEFSQEKKMFYAGEVGRLMTEKIRNKEAVLYDGALETLRYLKDKGYHLLYRVTADGPIWICMPSVSACEIILTICIAVATMTRNQNMKFLM